MAIAGVRKEAFWLYGVITALAVREALVKVVPGIFVAPASLVALERLRLYLFLIVAIRFYLGAASYFEDVYSPEKEATYPRKSFGFDFFVGFIHFVFIFVWATTITLPAPPDGFSPFYKLLLLILAYDIAWLLLSWKFDTWYRIKMWAMVNLLTALLSFFVVLVGMFLFNLPITSLGLQICAFVPIVLASLVDFAEMFTGDQLVERYGGKLFKTRPT